MALVDERRKTLSARLDNTRFRVELEATKHEAAKAWKHAWEEAESEYAKKETKLAHQLEMDRLKLERDLAEVTKSKEEEFEELIREEVERRETELPAMRDELSRLSAQWEGRLWKAHEHERQALERQRIELAGSVEEKLELHKQQEKEERVEQLAQKATKRILNQGIMRGFSAWQEQYLQFARHRRMLAAAGARLTKPLVAAAMSLWRGEWEKAQKRALLLNGRGELAVAQARILELEEQVQHLQQTMDRKMYVMEGKLREQEGVSLAKARALETEKQSAANFLANQKDQRIEHLHARAVKRFGNQGVIRGWTAWQDQWLAKCRTKRMLKAAAARLTKPKLTASLTHWRNDWEYTLLKAKGEKMRDSSRRSREEGRRRLEEERSKLGGSLEEVRGKLAKQLENAQRMKAEQKQAIEELEAELQHLQEEKASQAKLAQADKQKALEQLRVELTGSAEEQAAAREAREREERVEALAGKAMRRIQNAGIIAGWTAWHDKWEEKSRQKRMLAAAGARLARPALSAAVAHWRSDWQKEQEEANKSSAEKMRDQIAMRYHAEMEEMQADHARQLEAAKADKEKALEQLRVELTGSAEEQAAAREAREREERVEALAGKAMRRIQNAGIIAGWTAWQTQWEEKSRQKRMLAAAGARLARPALAAAVAHWRADWDAAQRKALAEEVARREEARAGGAAGQAMAEMKAEFEAELAYVKQAAQKELEKALENQRIALTGTQEEVLAMQAQKQKEERVEQLAQKALKRIGNQGIMRGWTAWSDQYQEKARQKRMIAAAGARLTKPALAAAVSHWKGSWEADRRQQLAEEVKRNAQGKLGTVEQEMMAMRAQADAELAAAQQAAQKELERQLELQRVALTGTAEEMLALQKEQEKEKRVEQLAQKATKRILNQGIMRGWTAWQEQYLQAARHKRMLAAAGARLARPGLARSLSHWKGDWEAERRTSLALEVRRREQLRANKNAAASGGAAEEAMAAYKAKAAAELAYVKQAAAEHEAKELERLRISLTGSAEEMAAMQAEKDKEARVEHLAQKALKRIANQGIMRGWTAWSDQYQQAARQKRMLAAAGARIMRPALAKSVSHWKSDWEAERRKLLAQEVRRRASAKYGSSASAEIEEVRAQAEAEKATLKKLAEEDKRRALEKQRIELTGSVEEILALKAAEAKEARVEQLAQKAMKRIANQGIIRGFTAWQDLYLQAARQKRMLAAAGARISRPGLAMAMSHWKGDWEAERRLMLAQTIQRRAQGKLGTAEEEIAEVRAKMEAERAAFKAREKAALDKQRVELMGTAEERLAFEKEEESAKRIEYLYQLAARRMMHASLIRGWSAWYDEWSELRRQNRLLAGATSRLSKPGMVAAFKFLQHYAAVQKRNKLTSGWEQKLAMVQKAGEQLLKQERRAAAEKRLELQAIIRDLERQLHALGREAVVPIPPSEPVALVLYDISAVGVPDADAAGGSDPYCRITCLDHDGPKKEAAYTSYKPNSINPVWSGERLQVALQPGGTRPVRLLIEIWDKDIQTADDIIARAEIVLDDPKGGTLTLPLFAVEDGCDDVEAFTFSYEFQVEAEAVQATKKASLTGGNAGTSKRSSRPGSADNKATPAGKGKPPAKGKK